MEEEEEELIRPLSQNFFEYKNSANRSCRGMLKLPRSRDNPSVYLQYTFSINFSIPSAYLQYTFSVPSVHLQYTFSLPSVYLQYTFSIPSVYLQYTLFRAINMYPHKRVLFAGFIFIVCLRKLLVVAVFKTFFFTVVFEKERLFGCKSITIITNQCLVKLDYLH